MKDNLEMLLFPLKLQSHTPLDIALDTGSFITGLGTAAICRQSSYIIKSRHNYQ